MKFDFESYLYRNKLKITALSVALILSLQAISAYELGEKRIEYSNECVLDEGTNVHVVGERTLSNIVRVWGPVRVYNVTAEAGNHTWNERDDSLGRTFSDSGFFSCEYAAWRIEQGAKSGDSSSRPGDSGDK